jgi:SAM-dependent methyltransferase
MNTTPERIFQMMLAHVQTAALRGAIELDLFTAIAGGATTARTLAARCNASERGLRILCDYLAVQGLLTKSGDSYGLAGDAAAFLVKGSPAYMGGMTSFMHHPMMMSAASDVAETVRRGTSILDARAYLDIENEVWVEFARSMVPMVMPAAMTIPDHLPLFDGVAARYPNAQIVALDWPGVLAVAQQNAERAGVADRWTKLEGSAFEVDFGAGYDAVLLTNFLHHFDEEECGRILAKVRAALKPEGTLVTLEFVPNADRVSPPTAAAFSMTMLLNTPAGDAYTFAELDRMLQLAGFTRNTLVPVGPQSLIVSRA